jgi:catechol-2,3-dioxygenase
MEKPRIRHIAINVQDREKAAEYYKKVFQMEEKYRGPAARFIFPMVTWTSL